MQMDSKVQEHIRAETAPPCRMEAAEKSLRYIRQILDP